MDRSRNAVRSIAHWQHTHNYALNNNIVPINKETQTSTLMLTYTHTQAEAHISTSQAGTHIQTTRTHTNIQSPNIRE